ncbi:MAG: ABC transporter ATP-binding protein [Acidobacteriota bacterium]|nr:ABC transporter ATP-binding protein [Acidobacteriota bacterium]
MIEKVPLPIDLQDVTKRYRGGRGVEHVHLEVPSGRVFAFLGPNGAGKTTTIRILLDLIRPDSGTVRLFGQDLRSHSVEIRRRIGYLPGDLSLYESLTARELLTHFAHLRRGPPWSAIEELTARFDLQVDRPIRALSKGNRQKVGLVQALMGHPELVILDEPTSGLDPLVQSEVHQLVRDVARDGRTVFLSSHVLSEVGEVADQVGIIRDGVMVAVEEVAALRRRAVHYVDVRFGGGVVPEALTTLDGVTRLPSASSEVRLVVSGPLHPLLAVLADAEVEDLTIREPDLEDLFFTFMSDSREPAGDGTGVHVVA